MSAFGPYPGRVTEVHDGDTVFIDLDLGFGTYLQSKLWDGRNWLSCRVQRVRPDGSVIGINAPELSTKNVSRPDGDAARDFAQALLPEGTNVLVRSYGWDKYGGRFDGTIELPDGSDFGSLMVINGHAIEVAYGVSG